MEAADVASCAPGKEKLEFISLTPWMNAGEPGLTRDT